jgi:ribosome maturation protein Sdo1
MSYHESHGLRTASNSQNRPEDSAKGGAKVTRITYKDAEKSPAEVYIYADAGQTTKWRKDKSIPLVDVVQSFNIYESEVGGNTGIAMTPSKQTLETIFGTSNEDAIIEKILDTGDRKGSSHSI